MRQFIMTEAIASGREQPPPAFLFLQNQQCQRAISTFCKQPADTTISRGSAARVFQKRFAASAARRRSMRRIYSPPPPVSTRIVNFFLHAASQHVATATKSLNYHDSRGFPQRHFAPAIARFDCNDAVLGASNRHQRRLPRRFPASHRYCTAQHTSQKGIFS
jgi:hypothetical protein